MFVGYYTLKEKNIMGIFDKVKGAFGIDEEDEFDEDEMETEEEETPAENTFKADFSQPSQPQLTTAPAKKERNVPLSTGNSQLKVVLVKPERFDEATDIADSLNAKKTVVLNLESCSKETARRLVDFLSGVAYANDGNVHKIANSTFLITPFDADISGIGVIDDADNGANY